MDFIVHTRLEMNGTGESIPDLKNIYTIFSCRWAPITAATIYTTFQTPNFGLRLQIQAGIWTISI
jgi:hypothetical protein